MKKKKNGYEEDHSNQFGSENDLEDSGGIFDLYQDITAVHEPETDASAKEEEPSKTDPVELSPVSISSEGERIAKSAEQKSAEQKKKKQPASKGKILVAAIALGLVAASALFVIIYLNLFIVLGNAFGKHEMISVMTETLDLTGRDYDSYSSLSKLRKLKSIDLTDSSFDDLSVLYGCGSLTRVKLGDKAVSAEDCIALYKNNPNVKLYCVIDLDGKKYDSQITQVTAVGANDKEQSLFAALKELRFLDLTECEVKNDTFVLLSESLPECTIKARISINDNEFATDAERIIIADELTDKEIRLLRNLKNLKQIDLSKCPNPDKIAEITDLNQDIQVIKAITILGKAFRTTDEKIDLRGNTYTLEQVKSALNEALPDMPNLKKVDMCGCGLTDTEMEDLCNTYPKIKFVWIIHLRFWDVRTDAVIFSSLNGVHFSSEQVYEPLFKYCTDLVALDLGHNLMKDISKISSLKNLRAAILMDNKLTDISALSELKKLEFLEININRIQSVKPLENLNELMYVDLWSSMGITDLSPLYNHEKLQIAIFHKSISQDERDRFHAANPNCQTFYEVDSLKVTTNAAWRSSDYRKKLKPAFTNWKYVVGFDEKTGEFIYDYNTDQYDYM